MRILRLQAEGFMRLVAVDITPDGNLIEVRGKNEQGKSSLLDAIFATLAGASAAPVQPVRKGEEYAIIRTVLGDKEPELIVTRYFGDDGATSLKVENKDGATYGKAQTMLDALVGTISFDPLAFARMEPAKQAAELRRLVKLDVDLDESARLDRVDYEERTTVNRDGRALKTRIEAIPVYSDLPETPPDKDALVAELAGAAETNGEIERERMRRAGECERATRIEDEAAAARRNATAKRDEAARLIREAEEIETRAGEDEVRAGEMRAAVGKLPALAEPVDTAALSAKIAEADMTLRKIADRDERAKLETEFAALKAKSEALTAAMEARATARIEALERAEMPVKGLSLATVNDELIVTMDGVPFSQASSAQQLKVSTRIAMAANPRLKVLRIKEGSLLDEDNLKLLAEMAAEADYQIWAEFVGAEGAGIIMEAGEVKGATKVERVAPPKRRKKGEEAEGEDENRERTSADSPSRAADPKPERRKPQALGEIRTETPSNGELDL